MEQRIITHAGLVLFLFFSGTGCRTPRSIPVPAGGPEALPARVQIAAGRGVPLQGAVERRALQEAALFFGPVAEIVEERFPPWAAGAFALGFRTGPEGWLLVNHPDAPPGMSPVIQDILSLPAFAGAWPAKPPLPEGPAFLSYRGSPLFLVDGRECLRTGAGGGAFLDRLLSLVALSIPLAAPSRPEDRPPSAGPYLLPPAAAALEGVEARLVLEALDVEDPVEAARLAAEFCTIRRFRRRGLVFSAKAEEDREELRGGLPVYLRIVVFRALADRAAREETQDRPEMSPLLPDPEGAWRARVRLLRVRLRRAALLGWTLSPFARAAAGAAEALLLDRLRPGWGTALAHGASPSLFALLEETVISDARLPPGGARPATEREPPPRGETPLFH